MSSSRPSTSANASLTAKSTSSSPRSRPQSDRAKTLKTESVKKKPSKYSHQPSQLAAFEAKCSKEFSKLQSNCRLVLQQDLVR